MFAMDAARPLQLDRLAVGRDFVADDVVPARDQFGGGETLPGKGVADELVEKLAQRTGEWTRGLVHSGTLRH
jgi:hypothetical protein